MSWDELPSTYTANTLKRRQRGFQSKLAGEHFENMIIASLEWYRNKGVAEIDKTPEPMRTLSKPNRQGQFLACFTKSAQPDFQGTLAGGQSIVFEAKHTDTDRIEYSRLSNEQIDKLSNHHRLGAVTFILVSFGLQDFYRIPWETWRDMKAIYGYKHIKQPDLEPYRVKFIAGVIKLLEGIA